MADTELDGRLAAALKRRETAASDLRRLEGRYEAAKSAKEAVEVECRSKGVDPEQIGTLIQNTEAKYRLAVEQLELEVSAAEDAIKPFLRETE